MVSSLTFPTFNGPAEAPVLVYGRVPFNCALRYGKCVKWNCYKMTFGTVILILIFNSSMQHTDHPRDQAGQ